MKRVTKVEKILIFCPQIMTFLEGVAFKQLPKSTVFGAIRVKPLSFWLLNSRQGLHRGRKINYHISWSRFKNLSDSFTFERG